jgi:hypothetical protein
MGVIGELKKAKPHSPTTKKFKTVDKNLNRQKPLVGNMCDP